MRTPCCGKFHRHGRVLFQCITQCHLTQLTLHKCAYAFLIFLGLSFTAHALNSITGTSGDDELYGTEQADSIYGGGGHDTLYGLGGDDIFVYDENGNGRDLVSGGDGFDTVQGTSGDDVFMFRDFIDDYRVEKIDGGAGINVISGDYLWESFDFSETELVNISRIEGQDGGDYIVGSAGNDVIDGGLGVDSLYGFDGNDTFEINTSDSDSDLVNGGNGFDKIVGNDSDNIIRFREFTGENRVEQIDGGAGENVISGDWLYNELDFRETELINISRIEGQDGGDYIEGTSFDDIIDGGEGIDYLYGNDGDDTFLSDIDDSGRDIVN